MLAVAQGLVHRSLWAPQGLLQTLWFLPAQRPCSLDLEKHLNCPVGNKPSLPASPGVGTRPR